MAMLAAAAIWTTVKPWRQTSRSRPQKGTIMKNNRVLIRKGARELTPREIEKVTGAIKTTTVCTLPVTACDGDACIGECGH